MGGLAHQIEEGGIATTQISLVRLHTEKIRPPRALWVPFELGRPFGPPDDKKFQMSVLNSALELLKRNRGPVLEDYPYDAPISSDEGLDWVCPLNLGSVNQPTDEIESIRHEINEEIARLQPWYDRAVVARERTTFGISGLDTSSITNLFMSMLQNELPKSPRKGVPLVEMLRLSAEDIKAFYLEAISAQPGGLSGAELRHWFWTNTATARVLRRIADKLTEESDPDLQLAGNILLVPRAES